jgi:DNA-binding LacI/PurR family transcriptional regulator
VYCEISSPQLTSVNTMVFESGVMIAHKLVDYLEGRGTNRRTMLFTAIVPRESA